MPNDLLNPSLFNALVRAFKHVKVKDHGQPLRIIRYEPAMLPGGKRRLRAVYGDRGETYVTCCPICADTRFRLYINHKWAERDNVTGDRNLHLAHCFNEHCVSSGDGQLKLLELVYGDRQADPARDRADNEAAQRLRARYAGWGKRRRQQQQRPRR